VKKPPPLTDAYFRERLKGLKEQVAATEAELERRAAERRAKAQRNVVGRVKARG
jgi:hypothetical protein